MNAAMLLTSLTSKLLAGRNVASGTAEDVSLLEGVPASGDFAALLAQQFEGVDASSLASSMGPDVQPDQVAVEEGAADVSGVQPIDFSAFMTGQSVAVSAQAAPASEAQAGVDPTLLAAQSAAAASVATAVAAAVPQSAAPVQARSAAEVGQERVAAPLISASAARQSVDTNSNSVQRQPVAVSPASFAVSEAPDQLETPSALAVATRSGFDKVLSEAAAAAQAPAVQSAAMTAVSGLQAAAMPSVQPQLSTQPTAVLSPVVGQSAWGEALGDRMVWMVSQQHQGVELHLNPPALGPLEVRLSMSDGQATLSFSTQHLPVKEALESAAPRLKEMLGESGINLAGVSVNVGTFGQQRGAFEQREPTAPAWPAVADASDVAAPLPSGAGRVVTGRGMVDLFA